MSNVAFESIDESFAGFPVKIRYDKLANGFYGLKE